MTNINNVISKEQIKRIVNEIDPIGLIDPETTESFNEYNPETNQIFDLLYSDFEESKLADNIYKIFIDYFNEEIAGEKQKYIKIADLLLKELKMKK